MGATGLGEHRITVHLSSCHLLFTTTLLKMDPRYETFLTDLFHLGAIQFGEFMLKSKHTSPIYVDMRRLLSHPTLLNTVEDLMYDYAKELEYDVICGVPYGAIPLTSALSVKRSIPMIMQRKDAKAYGTKKIVEGLYKPGDKCLIIEDVITFGSSIAETARVLRAQGLIVTDALVILDRCQGASRNLENLGITKWSLFCLPDVLLLYEGRGLISNADCQRISSYLFNVTDKIAPSALGNGLQEGAKVDKTGVLSVKAASNTASLSHNLAKHLWQIALDKKSNLCVACKSSDPKEIIALAQKIGKFICMLIIRSDLICKVPLVDFISELKTCAKSKNFMIMDDRKFCDVSSIVEMQLTGGEWSIAKWVDFVTVLPFSGRGVFSAIRKVSAENKVACFSILSLHAKDSLIPKEFSEQSMKTAEKDIDVIAGVVCSKPPVLDSRFLYMTSADESDQALLRFEDFDEMQFLEVEYLEMNHGIQYADIYKVWAFIFIVLLGSINITAIFKFETVVMRSLYETPIFVDFQLAVSYPEIMNEIEELVHSCLLSNLKFHSICGVPEGGLPLASIISVKRNIPLLLYHKTKETTVTGKVIDGVWKKSDNCLIVDDVLMFGHSLADAADVLRQHELEVTDAIVLLDRCQGPENFLKSNDIRRHYLFNLTDVLSYLNEQALLTDFECLKISNHLLAFSDLAGKFVDQCTIDERMEPLFFSPDRLSMILHPKARKLWEIALSKHSNLCFACDLCSPREILRLVEAVAVNICSLKLHADLIAIKEMPDFFSRLKRLAQSKKFMLINDGNYCDDSDVVVELMLNSATKPASWADFVTVQCLNGSSVFEAIKRVNSDYSVACLPVVEMSTSGNFFTEEYKKRALSLAQQYRQIVAGFICQKRPINDPSFLYISPGVHYKRRLDDQNWRTPDKAVRFNRDDIVVVGRGITKEKYSRVWAYTYQQISWDAFIIMNNAAANVE
ncbi:Uridine 5'-monophosphate synthase [Trichinella sp. T9]|nr:Uridine 5'-monophosphate synthase [Trichinella sp. T9]